MRAKGEAHKGLTNSKRRALQLLQVMQASVPLAQCHKASNKSTQSNAEPIANGGTVDGGLANEGQCRLLWNACCCLGALVVVSLSLGWRTSLRSFARTVLRIVGYGPTAAVQYWPRADGPELDPGRGGRVAGMGRCAVGRRLSRLLLVWTTWRTNRGEKLNPRGRLKNRGTRKSPSSKCLDDERYQVSLWFGYGTQKYG